MSDLKRFQFNCVDGVEEEDKVYEKTKFLEVNEQGLHRVLPVCYLLDGYKQNFLLSNHIVYFLVYVLNHYCPWLDWYPFWFRLFIDTTITQNNGIR